MAQNTAMKVMNRLWRKSRSLTVGTTSVKGQISSGHTELAGSYIRLACVRKVKAKHVLKDINIGMAGKA